MTAARPIKQSCADLYDEELYHNPYRQNTRNKTANTPLFSLLFPTSHRPSSTADGQAAQRTPQAAAVDLQQSMLGVLEEQPAHTAAAISSWNGEVTSARTQQPFIPPPHDAGVIEMVSQVSESASMKKPQPHQSPDVTSPVDHGTAFEEDPSSVLKPPFRLRLKEVEKRFREEMEVHRGLEIAMDQLNTLEQEARMHQAELRTSTLLATLRTRNDEVMDHVFPGGWSDTHMPAVQPAAVTAVPPAVSCATSSKLAAPTATGSSALQDILATFSQPRRGGGTTAHVSEYPPTPPPIASKIDSVRCGVIRPEKPPQPYKRIRWVRKDRRPASVAAPLHEVDATAYSDDFVLESVDVSSGLSTIAVGSDSVFSEVATATISTGADDITEEVPASESTNLESAKRSVSSSIISDDVKQTATSISSRTDSVGSFKDTSSAHTRKKLRRPRNHKVDNATLSNVLGEFYKTCRQANNLTEILLGNGKAKTALRVTQTSHHSSRISDGREEVNGYSTASAHSDSNHTLQDDFIDVRRLRRFNQRLCDHLKALDIQRKVVRERHKLLKRAQILSRARNRMRADKAARLAEVVDDVEDLFDPRGDKRGRLGRGEKDDSISDEIPEEVDEDLLSATQDSMAIDDEVEDVVNFGDGDMGGDEAMDDLVNEVDWGSNSGNSVDDEIDDVAAATSVDDEAILNVIANESRGLNEVEDAFADRIAEVSDVADVVSDIANLPSDSAAEIESAVVDEVSAVASTPKTASVGDSLAATSIASGSLLPSQDVSTVEDERAASHRESTASDQSADNGDVSSVFPQSSESGLGWSSESDDDGEYERLLLAEDVAKTKHRRHAALRSVRVPPFTPLYDAHETTPSLSDEDAALKIRYEALRKASERYTAERQRGTLASEEFALQSLGAQRKREAQDRPTSPVLHRLIAYEEVPPSAIMADAPTTKAEVSAGDAAQQPPPYLTDDFASLQRWKQNQLDLFREILPAASSTAAVPMPTLADVRREEEDEGHTCDTPSVGTLAYHWGVLEAMLETRFNTTKLPDYDDWESEFGSNTEDVQLRGRWTPLQSDVGEVNTSS